VTARLRHLLTTAAAALLLATTTHAIPPTPGGPAGAGGGSADAPRQFVEPTPDEIKDITIEQKLGGQVPLDAVFEDETGAKVTLGDYFRSAKKPVVLQLGYFECPMLCGIISNGMLNVFEKTTLKIGADYDVISLSFDPTETSQLAALKKKSYMKEYDRPEEAPGWHFLVGDSENIRRLTEAVGFDYRWIDSAQQYSHPAALIILTPDGKISRYLFGVEFDPKAFRLSLVEASDGTIGTVVDDFLLTCFQFDGTTGRYALAAVGFMRVGGAITVVAVAMGLFFMFRRETRRALPAPPTGPADRGDAPPA
jgi:protein SCO1/2